MTEPNPWLQEPPGDRPADPHCGACRGHGFGYDLGYARTCRCRYSYDIDQWWQEMQAAHDIR
jgi:hypothetical protein